MLPTSQNRFKSIYQFIVNNFLKLTLIPIIAWGSLKLRNISMDDAPAFYNDIILMVDAVLVLFLTFLFIFIVTIIFMSQKRRVYLVDYACFKPPTSCRVPFKTFMERTRLNFSSDPDSIEFQRRILERSGLGEDTCVPQAIFENSSRPSIDAARGEAEMVIFSAMDALFQKTGLKPRDVDILVVNCSLFSPTPSISAMVVNKYKLRSNVKSFNLSGMGCSAGVISIDLAKDLLQIHPNSNAVVISTEIITQYYYRGKQRAMLLPNCLFRMGGVAILLSNKRTESHRAKYKLMHVVRTHTGADNKAFKCASEVEDPQGIIGVTLSKDLIPIASEALQSNLKTLGPLVLPAFERLLTKWKACVPDFKQAFEHFCIHAGGRAVIDELQKVLDLSSEHVEASRMALHRFGNTSSSSLWYELSYIEAKGRMRRGDRVWQIGFGSGFKCNSAVWKCNRSIHPEADGPWADCIDKYPVHIPEVVKI